MTEIYFQRTDLAKYGTWIQKNCLETDALTLIKTENTHTNTENYNR